MIRLYPIPLEWTMGAGIETGVNRSSRRFRDGCRVGRTDETSSEAGRTVCFVVGAMKCRPCGFDMGASISALAPLRERGQRYEQMRRCEYYHSEAR